MPEQPDLSVVIPAYNEEQRLPSYLLQVLTYLQKRFGSFEVIVVDDGSKDGTAAEVARFQRAHADVQLIRLPQNMGKGYAVRTGMLQARGKLRLFTDADGATPIEELEKLQRAIEGGAQVAVASRAIHDPSRKVKTALHRKIMGTTFNYLVRTLAVKGIHDTQCGFKLFTGQAASRVFSLQRIPGFGFDPEVLYLCSRNGYSIAEVPVNWFDVKGTKVRLVRDSLRMLGDLLRIRSYQLCGEYQDEVPLHASEAELATGQLREKG